MAAKAQWLSDSIRRIAEFARRFQAEAGGFWGALGPPRASGGPGTLGGLTYEDRANCASARGVENRWTSTPAKNPASFYEHAQFLLDSIRNVA